MSSDTDPSKKIRELLTSVLEKRAEVITLVVEFFKAFMELTVLAILLYMLHLALTSIQQAAVKVLTEGFPP